MQRDRQPRSGLATIKRDFSSNSTTDAPPAPAPGPPTAPKRSALSDTLRKAIQDGVASREADKASLASLSFTASQKRSLSPAAVPPPQKRQLPRSWGDFESPSATFPQGTSQSSLSFKSRSSMSSVPPFDMSLHGHEGEPDPHSVPPFEIKPAQQPATISLSDEQKNILQLVMEGTNIFYTGSAGVFDFPQLLYAGCRSYHCLSTTPCVERQTFVWGVRFELTVTAYICILSLRNADLRLGTGKSVLLREIIKSLHKKLVKMPDAVAVTASTGIYTQLSILGD
jgi:ATP-dependent DNA helicase PIF1